MFKFFKNLSQKLLGPRKEQVISKLSSVLSLVGVGGLAIAGLALWLFAEIADEVLEQETDAFDTAILQTLANFHTPLLNKIMIGVTFLGEPTVLAWLSLTFGLVLLVQKQWSSFIITVITATGAIVLNLWLKNMFSRARPELWERIIDVSFYSFPSGHAMISLVIYGFIGYWLASSLKSWRIPIIGITIFLIAAIGLSRLYLGVHWPTDVIAGYAAGLVWLITCILSLEVARKYFSTYRQRQQEI